MNKEELIKLLQATNGDEVYVQGRVADEYLNISKVELLEDGGILLKPE